MEPKSKRVESLTEKAIRMVEDVTKDPSYEQFLPFYHGTSTYHYQKIKQEGLWYSNRIELFKSRDFHFLYF